MSINLKTVGMIAAGVGVVAGGAFLLAGCSSEQDPQELPTDLFKKFDKNGDGVSKDEANITYQRTANDRTYGYRIGDYVQYTDTVKRSSWTESMARAQGAADTNHDALASWQELSGLAKTFDKDANGTLSRDERNQFKALYEPQTLNSHTEILSQNTGLEYRPVDRYPDTGGYGNGGWGTGGGTPNSPGDEGGYGGYPGTGGTGNSPGDGGGVYIPPSSGGNNGPGDSGSTPPSGNTGGNSTDNGNPSDGDF